MTVIKISDILKENSWIRPENTSKLFKKANSPLFSVSEKPDFRSLGKSNVVFTKDLFTDITSHFDSNNYTLLPAKGIDNSGSDTLFIGAGLQVVLIELNSGTLDNNKPYFMFQPSLRVSSLDKMLTKNGYSTSFTNVCTEEVNADFDSHWEKLNSWFNLLSKKGLYMGHVSLVEDPNWKANNLDGQSLLIYYGDLQLGDAVFIEGKTISGKPFTMSDIGFGIERILWALNKTERYFESYMPTLGLQKNDYESQDILRSLTLMSMSGIKPSHTAQGYRFRQYAKMFLERTNDVEPYSGLKRHYNNWSMMFSADNDFDKICSNIVNELHSQAINKLSSSLGLRKRPQVTTLDEFYEHLKIKKNMIKIS